MMVNKLSKVNDPPSGKNSHNRPGGMARWTSQPPQRQQTWVRIPPGYNVFINTAMLLCVFDLIRIVCELKKRNEGIGPKIVFKFAQSGVDVMITIFRDFYPFSAKTWRFSQKPMLCSQFLQKLALHASKTPIFSLNFSAKIFLKP
jgi:hypothetical protein